MIRTILIVDDEPRTRQGIKKTLELWAAGRYRIECMSNGVEAAQWLDQETAHLLITDVRMPEVSGLDLLKSLQERQGSTMTIVISGYAEFEYAQMALRLGAANYLLKPIDKQELLDAVQQALKLEEERHRHEKMEKIMEPRLVALEDSNVQPGEPVRDALDYIEKHLHDSLSLAELAGNLHLNASYFSVLFKEQIGIPFSEFVTLRRIQRAKELLIHTKLPIGNIAERVGYRTDKYFIKVFKQHEQTSPSRYRRDNSREMTIE